MSSLVDEIHRLPMSVEEVLYSAMEDFYIDIMIGAGVRQSQCSFGVATFYLDWCDDSGWYALKSATGTFWELQVTWSIMPMLT